jgi:hypothetical protein
MEANASLRIGSLLNSPEGYQTGKCAGVLGEIEILETSAVCFVVISKETFITGTLKVQ